ncbi:MAG TPA: Ig-like domain-containing protein [Bryobacteraceae bacterium]|nr:Ig-like domain-containing protein [Bryobacteraceae bacterium]
MQFAELDRIHRPSGVLPNDMYYMYQWHHTNIQSGEAWTVTTGSPNVTIAVLDTGVLGSHEDLSSHMVAGWNVYDNNSNTSDVSSHGTASAGSVAALTNNAIGVAGVCWECRIMPVRVSDAQGLATDSNIAAGLQWAADHGAKVIYVGYAVGGSSSVSSAAANFRQRGGTTVAPAGNGGNTTPWSDDPNVITVGATDSADSIYSWSNTGSGIDLVAPGCVSATTGPSNSYIQECGTSQSAAIVAGVAALIVSKNPGADVSGILRNSADDKGAPGWDPTYGAGRVNAWRALTTGAPAPDSQAPSVSFVTPANAATVAGAVAIQVSASDNVGVTSVSVTADGGVVCSFTAAPYSCSWNTVGLPNGNHTLVATARDAAGNSNTAAINVNVSNTAVDQTAPAVSFLTPANGAVVSGVTGIQMSATDNVGVTSVTVANGASVLCSFSSTPYSCSWNTATVPNGAYNLTATASDAAGNSSSASVVVTVSNATLDTSAPSVGFVTPANGATVSDTISLQVSASDNVGVTNVTIANGGVTLCSFSSAPFTCSWNTATVANGSYVLTATARDAAGNTSSASVSVYVSNTAPAPPPPSTDTSAPSVWFVNPGNGAVVSGNVSISVNASDNVAVTRTEVYVGGTLRCSAAAPAVSCRWNSRKVSGAATLEARAYDAAGNVGRTTITVTVQ